jgi:hypothetical protein
MRLQNHASRRPRRLVLGMTMSAALAVALAACSSSGGPTTKVPATRPVSTVPAVTTPTASTSAPSTAPVSGLSGRWSGQYSGTFTGTFDLNWTQSGSKLNGTIKISTPPQTLSLNGALRGSTISFGTVGSEAITYSGTVSGNSMSGTYRVNGSAGGPWSASKA